MRKKSKKETVELANNMEEALKNKHLKEISEFEANKKDNDSEEDKTEENNHKENDEQKTISNVSIKQTKTESF